jgi:hypothetical protein
LAEIEGPWLLNGVVAGTPALDSLTRTVFTASGSSKIRSPSVSRSRTKMLAVKLWSPETRLIAFETKTT